MSRLARGAQVAKAMIARFAFFILFYLFCSEASTRARLTPGLTARAARRSLPARGRAAQVHPSRWPRRDTARAGSPPPMVPVDVSPEQRLAEGAHQREAVALSRSLRWSAGQSTAARAATRPTGGRTDMRVWDFLTF